MFGGYFNGFIEGWGLFAEKLHTNTDPFVEFGSLEMEMLRTLRIVVDIQLNLHGAKIEDMIQYMSKYLTSGLPTITSEVYRYIAIPGQALGYRIGYEIISRYFFKSDSKINNKLSDKTIKKYNKMINHGPVPLTLLN